MKDLILRFSCFKIELKSPLCKITLWQLISNPSRKRLLNTLAAQTTCIREMHEMTLGSENLDRIRSRRAKERSGLAQITFKILSTLLTSPPCIFLLPDYIKSLRGFSPFFRLPPWRRLAKRSVVLVFVADVDPPITCVSVLYVYLHLSLVHLSRAFISVHLSAYHCGRRIHI